MAAASRINRVPHKQYRRPDTVPHRHRVASHVRRLRPQKGRTVLALGSGPSVFWSGRERGRERARTALAHRHPRPATYSQRMRCISRRRGGPERRTLAQRQRHLRCLPAKRDAPLHFGRRCAGWCTGGGGLTVARGRRRAFGRCRCADGRPTRWGG